MVEPGIIRWASEQPDRTKPTVMVMSTHNEDLIENLLASGFLVNAGLFMFMQDKSLLRPPSTRLKVHATIGGLLAQGTSIPREVVGSCLLIGLLSQALSVLLSDGLSRYRKNDKAA
jgi:hypothetical protein